MRRGIAGSKLLEHACVINELDVVAYRLVQAASKNGEGWEPEPFPWFRLSSVNTAGVCAGHLTKSGSCGHQKAGTMPGSDLHDAIPMVPRFMFHVHVEILIKAIIIELKRMFQLWLCFASTCG